jgi:NADH:ubiquinone oxidoreductase subunit 3 (subunit A)
MQTILLESTLALILIIIASSLIYVLGRRSAPKPSQNENERLTYACGEKAPIQKQRITVSLSKYLIYFVVLDSAVLLLAFATIITQGVNLPMLVLYLSLLLASSLILFEGVKDE